MADSPEQPAVPMRYVREGEVEKYGAVPPPSPVYRAPAVMQGQQLQTSTDQSPKEDRGHAPPPPPAMPKASPGGGNSSPGGDGQKAK